MKTIKRHPEIVHQRRPDRLGVAYDDDRRVLASEPFDMADYDPVGHVANTESFDAKTVAAICGGNAKKLLGLA